jgi:hypothetical protein
MQQLLKRRDRVYSVPLGPSQAVDDVAHVIIAQSSSLLFVGIASVGTQSYRYSHTRLSSLDAEGHSTSHIASKVTRRCVGIEATNKERSIATYSAITIVIVDDQRG